MSSLGVRKTAVRDRRKMLGFSLLEMLVVLTICLIVAGIGLMAAQPMLKEARVDSAYDTTLMVMRNTRNIAVTQRKRYIVTFVAPQTITVSYWGVAVPPAAAPAPVVVNTFTLPSDIQFTALAGLPNTGATVPDGFGTGVTAIDFDQGVGAGGQNYVLFMPDGSSQDTLGNLNSGVLYLARTADLYSSRAFTVFGSTGRIRGWRLYGSAAGPTWVQQ